MTIEAITIFGGRRFLVGSAGTGKIGWRRWIAVQLIGAAITLAGPLTVATPDE